MKENALVDITQQYYDSPDADNFYYQVWGGEDIHVGIYQPGDTIRQASNRTVSTMIAQLAGLDNTTKVLDIGAGYGGAARVLAKQVGCKVDCLNLSAKENQKNESMNQVQGLDSLISVYTGNFEALPFEDQSYEVVWCEDAILHSDKKGKVFEEINRVLKPGGQFIFTDPMQSNDCPQGVLEAVLSRIHLKEMGSVAMYTAFAEKLGWKTLSVREMPEQLVNHYSAVLEKLENTYSQLLAGCSKSYLDNMAKGLRHWVDAGKKGYLNWGILHFQKL